jgi:hypothetical protein
MEWAFVLTALAIVGLLVGLLVGLQRRMPLAEMRGVVTQVDHRYLAVLPTERLLAVARDVSAAYTRNQRALSEAQAQAVRELVRALEAHAVVSRREGMVVGDRDEEEAHLMSPEFAASARELTQACTHAIAVLDRSA